MVLRVFSTPLLIGQLVLHAWQGQRTIRRGFHMWPAERTAMEVSTWSRGVLRKVRTELHVDGAEHRVEGPSLMVCNHISWLDIFVINAWRPAVFVSKSEVAGWPLLGPLIKGAGTLFIERERRRDALKVVHELADVLRTGRTAAVFPEGTTTDGDTLLPFHANLLQAAISASVPIQPLALRYEDRGTGEVSHAPNYVGDTSLLSSLHRVASSGPIRARLQVLPPIASADGVTRRELAQRSRAAIARALGLDAGDEEAA
jgi:1-acyl-sn-glycerol-3-phosphate acyltransferase